MPAFDVRRARWGRMQLALPTCDDRAMDRGDAVKITGHRSLKAQQEWGRHIGDVNFVSTATRTPLHVLVLMTGEGIEGVRLGNHDDVSELFEARDGEDPRGVVSLSRQAGLAVRRGFTGSGQHAHRLSGPGQYATNVAWADEPLDEELLADVEAALGPVRDLSWATGRPENADPVSDVA